jgi:hypothetical protein
MKIHHLQALHLQRRRKKTSPFTPNFDFEYEPAPVTIPTIETTKAAAAFRAAMDQHEVNI